MIDRVISEYTLFPDELGLHWLVEPQSSQPYPVLVGMPGVKCIVVYDNGKRAHYDGWLRPLHDSQSTDEMITLTGIQAPSECCDSLQSA
jgi:hypothetical protein